MGRSEAAILQLSLPAASLGEVVTYFSLHELILHPAQCAVFSGPVWIQTAVWITSVLLLTEFKIYDASAESICFQMENQ